jgi:hypothetical protein
MSTNEYFQITLNVHMQWKNISFINLYKKIIGAKMHPCSRYNAKGRSLFCTGYHFIKVLTKLQMNKHFFSHIVHKHLLQDSSKYNPQIFRIKVSV